METVQAINTIAQLGGTALAIAVLIYVLAFFRGEVRANKKDLSDYIDKTLATQKEMQQNFLNALAEDRKSMQAQESYVRELTKDMITVLHTNNSHLQNLANETEQGRTEVQHTLRSTIEENQKEVNRTLKLIATKVGVDAGDLIK